MLDGDPAGRRGSEMIAARLENLVSVRVIELAAAAQPDQLPEASLQEILRKEGKIAELTSDNDPLSESRAARWLRETARRGLFVSGADDYEWKYPGLILQNLTSTTHSGRNERSESTCRAEKIAAKNAQFHPV